MYSTAFRRLSGVTQIVRTGEADVFHTRQQHTIKVAQVGRRLAELCRAKGGDICDQIGLDVEVVEAACLAHDLGHPPFGHIGEGALDHLVRENGDSDGFEGNAQTFRILTKLALRFPECPGLDLSRATLAACIKYPWFCNPTNPDQTKKWGAYRIDKEDFDFAREFSPNEQKTAEAELMDWADDIAYSVHDLEDFHRCGMLPWHRILADEPSEQIILRSVASWHHKPPDAEVRLREAFEGLKDFLEPFHPLLIEPYQGTREQRQQLRTLTSQLIGRYMKAVRLKEPGTEPTANACLDINAEEADEVLILKQITRDYITTNPSLIAQQKGQERIIKDLFGLIVADATGKDQAPAYLPMRLADQWDAETPPARFAADCIASLTEAEVVGLHARLLGLRGGSVLDPIVR